MGFFDFLKRKEPKKEAVELSLEDVKEFLRAREEKAANLINNQLAEIKQQIEQEKSSLIQNTKNLKTAELQNKKIPARAKDIMEGNRTIYIQKIRDFLEKVELPKKPENIGEFTTNLDRQFGEFEQSIGKSHRIMEEFFLENATAVSRNIKSIDKLVSDSKNLVEQSELNKIKKARKKFHELMEKKQQKENSRKTLSQLREKLEDLSKQKKKKQGELVALKASEDYRDVLEKISEKESLEKSLSELNSQMSHNFSELETALKKYENASEDKTAKQYLENPLKCLEKDEELKIAKLLNSINNVVSKNEITLKEKKKDKTLKTIEKLTLENLEDFRTKVSEIKQKISKLAREIESSQALKKEQEEIKEIAETENSTQEQKTRLEKLEKEISEINIESLKSDLEKNFLENLGEEVKIKR